jgi:hypothetical protein
LNVDVELSLVVIKTESSSVDTDDISNSVNDWEVFESGGIDDNAGVVSGFASSVEGVVNNLERTHESVLVYFIGESGINDDTINVVLSTGGQGDVAELSI